MLLILRKRKKKTSSRKRDLCVTSSFNSSFNLKVVRKNWNFERVEYLFRYCYPVEQRFSDSVFPFLLLSPSRNGKGERRRGDGGGGGGGGWVGGGLWRGSN